MERVPQQWRIRGQRYALRGKSPLSSEELEFLVAKGASISRILGCSREELKTMYPELMRQELAFAFPVSLLAIK